MEQKADGVTATREKCAAPKRFGPPVEAAQQLLQLRHVALPQVEPRLLLEVAGAPETAPPHPGQLKLEDARHDRLVGTR